MTQAKSLKTRLTKAHCHYTAHHNLKRLICLIQRSQLQTEVSGIKRRPARAWVHSTLLPNLRATFQKLHRWRLPSPARPKAQPCVLLMKVLLKPILRTAETACGIRNRCRRQSPALQRGRMAGAVVDFYCAEDIIINGDVKVKKDTLVSTVTTTKNGGDTGLLYPGQYYYIERVAPYGMVGNAEKHYVEIVYAGQTPILSLTVPDMNWTRLIIRLKSQRTDRLSKQK